MESNYWTFPAPAHVWEYREPRWSKLLTWLVDTRR